jgi:hypothetical protein
MKVRQILNDNTVIDLEMDNEEYNKRKLMINTLKDPFFRKKAIEHAANMENEEHKNLLNDVLKVSKIESLESDIFPYSFGKHLPELIENDGTVL